MSLSPIVIGIADLVTSDFTIAIKQVPVIMVGWKQIGFMMEIAIVIIVMMSNRFLFF